MRDNAVELVSFSQKYLKETGYFKGAVNGELTLSTKQAVQAFQQHHNLLATGEIDFDSFHIMMLYSPTEQSRGTSWWRDDAPFRGGVAPHSPAANVAIPTD
jgi:peptidoglycan hydrolase-like protein with peptidoglycan-binding domain